MKASLLLGSLLVFLAGSMAAQPRMVQKATAQTQNLVCSSGSGCNSILDTLAVEFAPTNMGNVLIFVVFGTESSSNLRTCHDDHGQVWIHFGPVNGSDGTGLNGQAVDYYIPQQYPPGITTVTCSGGISSGALMFFAEVSGAETVPFPALDYTFKAESSVTQPPIVCGAANSLSVLTFIFPATQSLVNGTGFGQDAITPINVTATSVSTIFTTETANNTPFFQNTQAVFSSSTPPGGNGVALFSFLPERVNGQFKEFKGWSCTSVTFFPAAIIDPFPQLMNGPKVVGVNDSVPQGSGADLLATLGRPVNGIAADGVTQILLRIPATNVGDQFTFTILDDQHTTAIPSEDGALGNPGDSSTNITQSQISTFAVNTTTGPFAFAVYRAPLDFNRGGGLDDNASSRTITIEAIGNGASQDFSITVVRPPVVLIHGLWSNWRTWNNFAPLVTGENSVDPRFSILRANYSTLIGPQITLSNPVYPAGELRTARTNSMGFAYNTHSVLQQMSAWIQSFRSGSNPGNIPVAAAQFDVVAHSMGGDIARTMPLDPNFVNNSNFGQGAIHKAITIGTPHQGTPLAGAFLDAANACVRDQLSGAGLAFASATVAGTTWTGAVGDLNLGSPAIQAIQGQLPSIIPPNTPAVPTALIAGVYTDWAALNNISGATWIRLRCPHDPLAQSLTPAGWPRIFAPDGQDQRNDTMVSATSALNGDANGNGFVEDGFVHARELAGTTGLGFSIPSELDPTV